MFNEFLHHVCVHMTQHPKETAAAALAAGKVAAPVLIAAAPYVACTAAAGAIIYGICELIEKKSHR